MARPLEFDRDEALNAAMEQFWRDGYEASSIQKLLEVMGINRGSLYASFGDKETLFQASIKQYEDAVDELLGDTLIAIEDPIEAITEFLHQRFLRYKKKEIARGCFLISSISELSHTEPKLARMVVKKQKTIEVEITKRLQEAKEQSLIKADADCKVLAAFIMVVICGMAVRSKYSQDKDELSSIVGAAMKAIV